jgi:hypothetical protein
MSPEGGDALELVLACAANEGGEFNVGSHCRSCYARKLCPQYLMPLDLAETTLAPLTVPGALTHDTAAAALLAAQRAADTAERVIALVKQYARDHGAIPDGEGKVWGPIQSKGRTGLNRVALEKAYPDIVREYTTVGAPYDTFRWVNDPAMAKPKKSKKAVQ